MERMYLRCFNKQNEFTCIIACLQQSEIYRKYKNIDQPLGNNLYDRCKNSYIWIQRLCDKKEWSLLDTSVDITVIQEKTIYKDRHREYLWEGDEVEIPGGFFGIIRQTGAGWIALCDENEDGWGLLDENPDICRTGKAEVFNQKIDLMGIDNGFFDSMKKKLTIATKHNEMSPEEIARKIVVPDNFLQSIDSRFGKINNARELPRPNLKGKRFSKWRVLFDTLKIGDSIPVYPGQRQNLRELSYQIGANKSRLEKELQIKTTLRILRSANPPCVMIWRVK